MATSREQPPHVSFGHKLLQEWVAAYFIVRCLGKATDIQVNINLLFLKCPFSVTVLFFLSQVRKSKNDNSTKCTNHEDILEHKKDFSYSISPFRFL